MNKHEPNKIPRHLEAQTQNVSKTTCFCVAMAIVYHWQITEMGGQVEESELRKKKCCITVKEIRKG